MLGSYNQWIFSGEHERQLYVVFVLRHHIDGAPDLEKIKMKTSDVLEKSSKLSIS
jgi:hypothetical protein